VVDTPQRVVEGKDGRSGSRRLALVVVVVGVDFPFFRNRFWERLIANVVIVLVFWAFYLMFLQQ
jgi:hypothetical protein